METLLIMKYNWQQTDWTDFTYDSEKIRPLEEKFTHALGESLGAFKHVSQQGREVLTVDLLSEEALKTSAIEGETLNRDSVHSSICRHLGLQTDNRRIPDKEYGIASMMVDLYENFDSPLTHEQMFKWHSFLFDTNPRIEAGQYRTDTSPMQVVSGSIHNPKVHFEAPPYQDVPSEMENFIKWYNTDNDMSPLIKAGIAHLYFESIHPFEDGNGRIGRAIVERYISQHIGRASLLMVSYTVDRNKNDYYKNLERSSKTNDVTNWLLYFGNILIESQYNTIKRIEFIIEKTRLYDAVADKLNERQEKVLTRMFQEGIDGFKGGLSAKNYSTITGSAVATTTRDLNDMIDKGVLIKTGKLKSTRYHLSIPSQKI